MVLLLRAKYISDSPEVPLSQLFRFSEPLLSENIYRLSTVVIGNKGRCENYELMKYYLVSATYTPFQSSPGGLARNSAILQINIL